MSLRQLLSRHTRVPTILSSRTYIGLPDEVQMLKDMTRTFAEQELAPIASKIDKERIHIIHPAVRILRALDSAYENLTTIKTCGNSNDEFESQYRNVSGNYLFNANSLIYPKCLDDSTLKILPGNLEMNQLKGAFVSCRTNRSNV